MKPLFKKSQSEQFNYDIEISDISQVAHSEGKPV
jgi:hypothetical protein